MKTVVITGGTRGIGRGLVEEFLKRDCQLMLTGREESAVRAAVDTLAQNYSAERVEGCRVEVSRIEDLQALWDRTIERFGKVDIWINNAGISLSRHMLWEHSAEDLQKIVDTNLTGLMFANKVAISNMLSQGSGQIWNMEGFGSDGRSQPGMSPYGASKRGVNYLNAALAKEVKDTPVQVCTLSPGIVVTDLLKGDYDPDSDEWQRVKRVFNILADTVETVTPFLADGILASNKNGAKVAWLTNAKAMKRFMLAPFNKRDLFAEIN